MHELEWLIFLERDSTERATLKSSSTVLKHKRRGKAVKGKNGYTAIHCDMTLYITWHLTYECLSQGQAFFANWRSITDPHLWLIGRRLVSHR